MVVIIIISLVSAWVCDNIGIIVGAAQEGGGT